MIPATVNTNERSDYSSWFSTYAAQCAKRLDDDNRWLAKYLHESLFIYALYGALDGLSISYSMIKYCFDMMSAVNKNGNILSSDAMHDWMLTPEGIATVVVESLVIITASVLANLIDDEEKDAYRGHQIARYDDPQQELEKGRLYLYLAKGLIHCVALDKKGKRDDFVLMIDDPHGTHVPAITAYINDSSPLTKQQLQSIIQATTRRNNVQAKYQFYLGFRYGRDMSKGLKNAYKGLRATTFLSPTLKANRDLFLFPVALGLGVLSGVNRIWYRRMKDHRKMLQSENKLMAKEIRALTSLSYQEAEDYFNRIGRKSTLIRCAGILSAAYGGLIDGLYLYMGVFGLALFTPLALQFLVGCSLTFLVICIATRIYTEYEYQHKLIASELMAELTICGKRIETLCVDLQSEGPYQLGNEAQLSDLQKELNSRLTEFCDLEESLLGESKLTLGMAVLSGLRDGLALGGAVGSLLFAVATVMAMLTMSCPPVFVIACVTSAMVLVIAGLTRALVQYQSQGLACPPIANGKSLLADLKSKKKTVEELDLEELKQALWDGSTMDAAPQTIWQDLSEVFRSFFSGLAKGQKAVDYMFNPLQELDEDGHCRDTSFMIWATLVYAVLFAFTLALRADARLFGSDNAPKRSTDIPPEPAPEPYLADKPPIDPAPNTSNDDDTPTQSSSPSDEVRRGSDDRPPPGAIVPIAPIAPTVTQRLSSFQYSTASSLAESYGFFNNSTRLRTVSESELMKRHNDSPTGF